MTRKTLTVGAALLFLACGSGGVVRDAEVYQTEQDFWEQAALQQAEALAAFIDQTCKCDEGKFQTAVCRTAANHVVLMRARVPWHKAMALYNAGLSEVRPSKDPPVVPEGETLCPQE